MRLSSRRRRDAFAVANRRLPFSKAVFFGLGKSLLSSRSPAIFNSSFPSISFEDRRMWHPEGDYAPARSVFKSDARLTIPRKPGSSDDRYALRRMYYPSSQVAFAIPSRVAVCVRRHQRQEVLHALGKTGKVGQRSPKWGVYSSVSCKE